MNRLITIVLSLVIVGGLACQQEQKYNPQTKTNRQSVAGPVSITSPEATRQAAVGVWTNTYPLNTVVQMMFGWNRFVFREDGTYERYQAMPIDDDWSGPKRGHWKIYSNKYINTGKRYYGISWDDNLPLVFVDAQTIQMRDCAGELMFTLKKGDAFPFSR